MFYYIYYVLFNDNSYKPIVIIAVYDTVIAGSILCGGHLTN